MDYSFNARLVRMSLTTSIIVLMGSKPFTDYKGPVANDSRTDSSAVAAAVNGFHEALGAGDSLRALALLANDVVILESGEMETRAEYRSHHLSADIAFTKAVKSVQGTLKITISGNTAWAVSTSTTQGEYKGRKINSVGAESMVLTRSKQGWMIRSIHWSSRSK